MLPVPAAATYALATLLDRFEFFPLTRDQLTLLLQGNTCSDETFDLFGIHPKKFDGRHLDYVNKLN